jgi:hypothetical protein
MKTLLERLKPEVLEAMNEDAEKYPHLIASLKKSLEKELISPLYLTVNVASSICQYNKTNLDIVNLLDCFNKE